MSASSVDHSRIVSDIQPPTETSALVRKLGSLCLMSEEEINFLEGLQNNTVEVERGADFVVEGDARKATFIVIDGWAIRYTALSDGRRQILSYALPGDILGLHINFNVQATYSTSALTDMKLAEFNREHLAEFSI